RYEDYTVGRASHLIHALSENDPVVIHTNSTAHAPTACFSGIPGKADSGTPQISLRVRKNCRNRSHTGIGDLCCQAASGSQEKAAELKPAVAPRTMIGEIVPAQRQRQRKIRPDLPVVLTEEAERSALSAKHHLASLTC